MNILPRSAIIMEGERVVINENEKRFFKEVYNFLRHSEMRRMCNTINKHFKNNKSKNKCRMVITECLKFKLIKISFSTGDFSWIFTV